MNAVLVTIASKPSNNRFRCEEPKTYQNILKHSVEYHFGLFKNILNKAYTRLEAQGGVHQSYGSHESGNMRLVIESSVHFFVLAIYMSLTLTLWNQSARAPCRTNK